MALTASAFVAVILELFTSCPLPAQERACAACEALGNPSPTVCAEARGWQLVCTGGAQNADRYRTEEE
jgi:hypothetical protein